MHNPPHPGEFIKGVYIEPFNISSRKVARSLKVSASTLNRLLNGKSNISPEMALRLSRVLLAMQDQYDLWQARKQVNLKDFKKLKLSAA